MAKVDLELLREARRQKEEAGMFCQDCGETDPEDGFYPMGIFDQDSLSWFLCHACEKKRRREVQTK